MPKPLLFGYKWYSTGHIHQLSIRDFYDFCAKNGFEILSFQPSIKDSFFSKVKCKLIKMFPNALGNVCMFLIRHVK